MKNILILADGSIARHFIEWIGRKRIANNQYYVTCYSECIAPEKMSKNITLIKADPTSYSKLRRIMEETKYSNVFIVMDSLEDAKYSLKNVRHVDDKIRTVLVNQWDDEEIGKDVENLTILNSSDLIASHLYDYLPNVPVVAQNVGLGKGEIMEILVPFGSTYAFRHVGSILQRKWKIVALYRDDKQILPTNATMIRPNDRLLVVGKPLVLDGIYKIVNRRIGLFPEPFGKNLYLIIDLEKDVKNMMFYLKESIYLLDKLEDKSLFVRVINPNNFELMDKLKEFESENVTISIHYDDSDIPKLIEYDIQEYDIGLVLNSVDTFGDEALKETLFGLKKIVYLFGDKLLYDIKSAVILMDNNEKMESISSTAFDISESLELNLKLCNFDPEGDFDDSKMIVEHYETLSHIFSMEIEIEEKTANPIRELSAMEDTLQIAPFESDLSSDNLLKYVSTKIEDYLLTTKKHPKLLVPFALGSD